MRSVKPRDISFAGSNPARLTKKNMTANESFKIYCKKHGYSPAVLHVDEVFKCENCGKELCIKEVGGEYWIGVIGSMLVLGCCKDNSLEQGGVFSFARENHKWVIQVNYK